MDIKKYIAELKFVPKDGTNGIYHKIYAEHNNYVISINSNTGHIEYGDKIIAESKTTQNFSQSENFVVLECVDRLLTKGYEPQNIVLEKTWPSGHGTSGRLDICVNREDGTPYMLIECKTFGKEYNKELARIRKDGGQLFTYFQLSGGKADVLTLYASELKGNEFVYVNEIVKIEDDYRNGDVKDIYEKWNKLTKDNGIFDSWVQPYNFQSKALTKEQLKEIKAEDSSFIFNRFLEILRHNVVSDKGNAFNKIFTLFLCKVYDETTTGEGEELKFQWLEGRDNHIDFQLRLTDLYSKGMKKFLDRIVSDFNNEDFDKRCANLNEDTKQYLLREVNKLRLEKNNEFAIKEVYDNASFEENAKVVKEVVELIQGYRIRYNKRQQYLSDFFELLLTTGLKQEAGQYFTPVPIAQFIIKSLPLDSIVAEKLSRKDGEILPYMIDYAAGSGHFITEFMHEIQDIINECDASKYIEETRKHLINWQNCHFDWATDYVYGIEKDYRLVKVGKVGCYLHGDGLANVILSDGLANFCNNKEYKGKLRKQVNDGQKDNQQFDIVLSNPPYSVSSFRQTTRDYYTEQDFELYTSLTDNSSEIECLFIERTKQLLKEGGIAGVILPSSILSNSGIYTKVREIILQYFDIVAIAELGSNTFMATNTNTVVLFLHRRDNYFAANTKNAVDTFFRTLNDVTINGIETPASKYVAHVWEGLDYADYVTLLQKSPNDKVKAHEIYAEYKKKISAKNDAKLFEIILNIEAEKLLYFILAYPQKVVIVKSGEKDVEKHFLGYEFSNRRGNEGIHAIQKGKNVDECTKLFDVDSFDNPDKASTYIYRAFKGDYISPVAESMQSHVYRMPLIDMLAFERGTFEKNVSLVAKKKVEFNTRWQKVKLGDIATIQAGNSAPQGKDMFTNGMYPFFRTSDVAKGHLTSNLIKADNYLNEKGIEGLRLFKKGSILFPKSGVSTYLDHRALMGVDGYVVSHLAVITIKNIDIIIPKYLYEISTIIKAKDIKQSSGYPSLNEQDISSVAIPLPPINVQKQIVEEIEKIDEGVKNANNNILNLDSQIVHLLEKITSTSNRRLGDIATFKNGLNYDRNSNGDIIKIIGVGDFQNNKTPKWESLGDIEISGNLSEDYELHKNDILAVRSNGSVSLVGRFLLIDKEPHAKTSFSGFTIRLRLSNSDIYDSKFLFYYLSSPATRDKLIKNSSGSNIKSLNQTLLSSIEIPAIPLDEQKNIVSQIETLEVEIAKARNLIANAVSEKRAVLDEFLK